MDNANFFYEIGWCNFLQADIWTASAAHYIHPSFETYPACSPLRT